MRRFEKSPSLLLPTHSQSCALERPELADLERRGLRPCLRKSGPCPLTTMRSGTQSAGARRVDRVLELLGKPFPQHGPVELRQHHVLHRMLFPGGIVDAEVERPQIHGLVGRIVFAMEGNPEITAIDDVAPADVNSIVPSLKSVPSIQATPFPAFS